MLALLSDVELFCHVHRNDGLLCMYHIIFALNESCSDALKIRRASLSPKNVENVSINAWKPLLGFSDIFIVGCCADLLKNLNQHLIICNDRCNKTCSACPSGWTERLQAKFRDTCTSMDS